MTVYFVKLFIHSLGIAYLNDDVSMFVVDQIVLKTTRDQLEIYLSLAIMLYCLKDILLDQSIEQVMHIIKLKAKTIPLNYFTSIY